MADINRNEAAQIATLCTECGVPQMAAGFIAGGLSLDDVKTRVSAIGTVHTMAAMAEKLAPGVTTGLPTRLLAEGKTVPEIRTAIFEALVAEQDKTEISSHVPLVQSDADRGRMRSRASMEQTLRSMGMTPRAGA